MLKIQERSPQYLTLMEKSAELHTIIACNPLIVARKFQAHGLVDINTVDNTTKGVDSGRDLALVVNQLMKNVRVKIQFEPNAFYSLVDALEECADQLPVGKVGLLLKEHCEQKQKESSKADDSTAISTVIRKDPNDGQTIVDPNGQTIEDPNRRTVVDPNGRTIKKMRCLSQGGSIDPADVTDPRIPIHQRVVPFQFTFYNYEARSKYKGPVNNSQNPFIGRGKPWMSHSFYTHEYGYKMCIGVAPQGVFEGKGTHLSLYAFLMKGDYDNNLPWPFRGAVYLKLINQLDPNDGHYRGKPIVFDNDIPSVCCTKVTMGDYSPHGWANSQFISNALLHQHQNTQYLKDDTVIIRVNSVRMANKITFKPTQPAPPPMISTNNTPFEERIVPYEFTMNYSKLSTTGDESVYNSREFYSHRMGYKMYVEVVPQGRNIGKDTHLSVYVHLMRGEYDDDLTWPFQGKVTIQLVNQEADDRHREVLIYFNELVKAKYCERVYDDYSPHGWGTDVLISRSSLESDEEYREKYVNKDGVMKFRVVNVTCT